MDKVDAPAREHIAGTADLIGAIRLPEGSFRADAGTDVVVDILSSASGSRRAGWGRRLARSRGCPSRDEGGRVRINRWFADHPEMVLGRHAVASGPFGETYTCRPPIGDDLKRNLNAAISQLPVDL